MTIPQAIIWAVLIWGAATIFLPGCAMTRGPVTKQAPDPPYAGERHGGMDRAVYLRVEEALDELRF